MKIEMEGKEVTWCIGIAALGIPVLTAVILCAGMGVFVWLSPRPQERGAGASEQPIQVNVSSEVKAVLPDGAIQVHNTVPAAQIHEVLREVVKVPDVRIVNEVRPPDVRIAMPEPKAIAVPVSGVVAPVEKDDEYGTKIPPPKGK